MSDIILEIKALARRFGAFTAVEGLTFSVNASQVLAYPLQRGRQNHHNAHHTVVAHHR